MPTHTKTRRLTVSNKGFNRQTGRCAFFPMIQLCGKWLQESGFKAGHTIDITCKRGKIIISKSELQRLDVK